MSNEYTLPEARPAGLKTAKLAAAVPPLQQMRGIEPPLLAPPLLDPVGVVLASAEIFQNFALAKSLLVSRRGLQPHRFETADLFLQPNKEFLELFTQHGSELQLGSRASGSQRSLVNNLRLREKCTQARDRILGAGELQGGILQREHALALDALPKTKQGSECETEGHRFTQARP
jgi:hypothetical protein